jgi:predicted DNA-binding helix-hairpin-helix protein
VKPVYKLAHLFYNKFVDTFAKLTLVSNDNFPLEADSSQECAPQINGKSYSGIPISEVTRSGGVKMKVLKSMLTTACERNCYYCPFRAGRSMRRANFKPDEMATTFMEVHNSGAVEGMFLSSGILKGGITTQDKLLDTAEILRKTHHYRGYLHLKIMPGAERDQVKRAMQLANRVSVNLEAATEKHLEKLAPKKDFFRELFQPLKWAHEIRQEFPRGTWNGRWASSVTQFVVGAVGESDLELVSVSERLYRDHGLQRAYYSPFHPIENTPLEHVEPESETRKLRLYQSSFLLRDYGFSMEEMPFDLKGNLPRDIDPKTAMARQTLIHTPIEINSATKEELLRVPGFGPKSVEAILRNRRLRKFVDLSQLKKIGIQSEIARDFILMNGKRPARQLALL